MEASDRSAVSGSEKGIGGGAYIGGSPIKRGVFEPMVKTVSAPIYKNRSFFYYQGRRKASEEKKIIMVVIRVNMKLASSSSSEAGFESLPRSGLRTRQQRITAQGAP
jgi:hypothetical protein